MIFYLLSHWFSTVQELVFEQRFFRDGHSQHGLYNLFKSPYAPHSLHKLLLFVKNYETNQSFKMGLGCIDQTPIFEPGG